MQYEKRILRNPEMTDLEIARYLNLFAKPGQLGAFYLGDKAVGSRPSDNVIWLNANLLSKKVMRRRLKKISVENFNEIHPELKDLGEGWRWLANIDGTSDDIARIMRIAQSINAAIEYEFITTRRRFDGKKELKLGWEAFTTDGEILPEARPVFVRDITKNA